MSRSGPHAPSGVRAWRLLRAPAEKRHNRMRRIVTDTNIVLQPQPLAQPVCRDPDDDEVLALALLAQAQAIVSGDNDLLVLQRFEDIAIITAAQALAQLELGG